MRTLLPSLLVLATGAAWFVIIAFAARSNTQRGGRMAERFFVWTLGFAPLSTVLLPRSSSLAGYGNVSVFPSEFIVASRVAFGASLAGCLIGIFAGRASVGVSENPEGHSSVRGVLIWSLLVGAAYILSSLFGTIAAPSLALVGFPFIVVALYLLRPGDVRLISRDLWLIAVAWIVGSLVSLAVAPAWATATAGFSQEAGSFLNRSLRLRGLTDHPNEFGMLALQAAILSVYQSHKWSRAFGIVISVVALVLSGSRTPLFALGFCLFLAWYFRAGVHRSAQARSIALLLGMGSVLTVVIGAMGSSDLAQNGGFSSGASTLQGRTEVWRITLTEWQQSPLTGYGPTLWSADYRMSRAFNSFSWVGQAHNQYLETLGMAGLVGAAALTGLFVALCRLSWRRRVRDGGLTLVLLVSVALNSLTERTLALGSFPMPLFPMLALLVVAMSTNQSDENDSDLVLDGGTHDGVGGGSTKRSQRVFV